MPFRFFIDIVIEEERKNCVLGKNFGVRFLGKNSFYHTYIYISVGIGRGVAKFFRNIIDINILLQISVLK